MAKGKGESDLPIETEIGGWLGRNLRRATNAVFGQFATEFEAYRIRPALYLTLTIIEHYPGSSGAEISQRMEVPRANTVVILQELEQRGLIRRTSSSAGGRSQSITLTEAGSALLVELHAANRRHIAYFDAQLSEAERTILTTLLQRLWKPASSLQRTSLDDATAKP